MTRRAAAILILMLSLPAASLLVAAGDVGVDTIRLPSDGGEGLATSKGGEEATLPLPNQVLAPPREENDVGGVLLEGEERPWVCCNSTVCTKSFPPTCRCLDEVEECGPACKRCEPSGINPNRHVCNDQYHGDPGPTCAKEERPWACCDRTVCTKSLPPTCRCLDEVEECAPACKRCEPFGINPKIHVCNDQYHGDPGPKCGKDDHHHHDVPAGSPSLAAAGRKMQLLLGSLVLMFIQSR
ncbi:Bowman-Birk type trypsin inhibitor-like [Hordeum vulgare subsp. vulgare]|uniref:Bowman-Birk serine protease inhibitors family domain-containing protein n=1 Tax=Hordeum vulgare subsp. vulgare TaxID=112509 RepID=A0A287JZA2_HORVV|nr:Bowman-Birk type trypsin inhibitor-like [Hordeum vulgare subsp. vulgare]